MSSSPIQPILDHMNAGSIFPFKLQTGNGIFAKPEALDTKYCTEVPGAIRVNAKSLHTALGERGFLIFLRLMQETAGKEEVLNVIASALDRLKSDTKKTVTIAGEPMEFEYLGKVGRKQGSGTDRGII
jgi:hypothetical protein